MNYMVPSALLILSIFGIEQSEAVRKCHHCAYQRIGGKYHGSPDCQTNPSSTATKDCGSGGDLWMCGTVESEIQDDKDFAIARDCVLKAECDAGKKIHLNGAEKLLNYHCCDKDGCNAGHDVTASIWVLLMTLSVATVIHAAVNWV